MPAARRVRWAQLRVGFMAIAAMVILAVLIWLLTSRNPIWQSYAKIYTYVRDSAALAEGAPVRLNGISVGNVGKVELTNLPDPERTIRVTMRILESRLASIPVDSMADIGSENVLSGKYVAITRGQSSQPVRNGGEIRGQPSPEIADLVKKGFGIFDSAQAVISRLDRLVGEIESGKGSVGKFLVDEEFYNRLVATIAEFQKIAATMSSGKGTIGRLLTDEGLYNEFRAVVARLDTMMQDIQQGQGTAGKLLKDPALYNETRESVAQFKRLLNDINAGKGTAGKLLKDEEVYGQIRTILSRIDTTIERVNSGQGTVGQMLVNSQLYESFSGLSRDLRALVKDIRADPQKFLRIKLALF